MYIRALAQASHSALLMISIVHQVSRTFIGIFTQRAAVLGTSGSAAIVLLEFLGFCLMQLLAGA